MTDVKRETEKIKVRERMARCRAKQKAEAVGGVAAVGAAANGTTTGKTTTGPTVVLGMTVDPPPSPEKEEPMTIAVDALMALHGPNVIPSPLHPSPSLVRQPTMEAEATIIDLQRASARKRKARSRAKKKEAKHAAERIMVAVAGAAADGTTTTSTTALDDNNAPFAPKLRSAADEMRAERTKWLTASAGGGRRGNNDGGDGGDDEHDDDGVGGAMDWFLVTTATGVGTGTGTGTTTTTTMTVDHTLTTTPTSEFLQQLTVPKVVRPHEESNKGVNEGANEVIHKESNEGAIKGANEIKEDWWGGRGDDGGGGEDDRDDANMDKIEEAARRAVASLMAQPNVNHHGTRQIFVLLQTYCAKNCIVHSIREVAPGGQGTVQSGKVVLSLCNGNGEGLNGVNIVDVCWVMGGVNKLHEVLRRDEVR